MIKNIIIICIVIIVIILLAQNIVKEVEKFEMNKKLNGISGTNGKKSVDNEIVNLYNQPSSYQTNANNVLYMDEQEVMNQQKYLDNKSQVYNQILLQDMQDVVYYYNDMVDQNGITYDANDIINQKDKIDYSKVRTGYQKCLEGCTGGLCVQNGYSGNASCIPLPKAPFDFGTLWKNPEFTYQLQDIYHNVNDGIY